MDILKTILGVFLFRTESYLRLKKVDAGLKIAAIIAIILTSLGSAYSEYRFHQASTLVFLFLPLLYLLIGYLVAEIIVWLGRKIEEKPSVWSVFALMVFIGLPATFSFISPIFSTIYLIVGLIWSLYGIKVLFNCSWGQSVKINVLALLIVIPIVVLLIIITGLITHFMGIPLYYHKTT